jgi:hypothetical protein
LYNAGDEHKLSLSVDWRQATQRSNHQEGGGLSTRNNNVISRQGGDYNIISLDGQRCHISSVYFMFQSKGITQQNLHLSPSSNCCSTNKSEHQMKRNEISCGSSEKGRGVRQATSSGALRKAAPMPKASLLPKAVLLPEAASTLNKISCGSSEKGSGARQAASSVVVAAMMATVVAMPPVLRATMAFRPLYYRINFLGGLPLRVTLEIDLALLDKLQCKRLVEVVETEVKGDRV